MYYTVKAVNDNRELTFKTNDILEVLPRVRDLWNKNFRRIDVVDMLGAVLFHADDDENEDVFMSPEMKLMWMGFFLVADH